LTNSHKLKFATQAASDARVGKKQLLQTLALFEFQFSDAGQLAISKNPTD
jgi:hypothetical protein